MKTKHFRRHMITVVAMIQAVCMIFCISYMAAANDGSFKEMIHDENNLSEEDRLYNSLPHPYLAGYYSEDGSEITITGTKCLSRTGSQEKSSAVYMTVDGMLEIPADIDGVPVTQIAPYAFSDDRNAEHIQIAKNYRIGKNVRKIGDHAFEDVHPNITGDGEPDSEKTKVSVGKKVTEVNWSAFEGCRVALYYQSAAHRAFLTSPQYRSGALQEKDCLELIYESYLYSAVVSIDDGPEYPYGIIYLHEYMTKKPLERYVFVEGYSSEETVKMIRVLGDSVEEGTLVELVDTQYGTVDRTYIIRIIEGDHLTEQDKLYNSLPHPYLAGYYSEDGSEITITGTKCLRRSPEYDVNYQEYPPTYMSVEGTESGNGTLIIPDEINGVPVTQIAADAFNSTFYYQPGTLRFQYAFPANTIIIGKNVERIGENAFRQEQYVDPTTFIIGKNVHVIENGNFAYYNYKIFLYRDSDLDRFLLDKHAESEIEGYIDESHLQPLQDSVKIDEDLTLHLPWNATAHTLTEYVSVDGDAKINVLGNTFGNGTQIELVNSTYGTIDNTYTVRLGPKPVTLKDTTVYAKTTFKLTPETADDGCTRTYTSDNPAVADVDKDGNVTAKQSGTAKITITVTDEYGNEAPKSTCTVTVNYTWWQWLIRIFLFGWLWY